MSELIRREDVQREIQASFDGGAFRWQDGQDLMDRINALPTASPWHRVEEPPKKHGKYPVCWIENGNFYWQEAHYCYYQDGDKWVAWSSYQGDDVEITPDYWMPIEPPKEDA